MHLQQAKAYLEDHKHARGNAWKRHPLKEEEVNPFLSIILLMGLVSFPTVR